MPNGLPKEDQKFIKENIPGEKEDLPWENDLPEAPVSITVRGYYKGFSVLITKRNAGGVIELEKIIQAIDNMVAKGFKPSWNDETNGKSTPKAETKTKACEQCGGTRKLVEGVKNGKKWAGWFCENEVSNCPVEWIPLGKK